MTVTREHVDKFAEITGDYNPLHFDEEFTAKTKFKKLMIQGGITSGLLNTFVAMDLPGPGTVFMEQNFKYLKPVYIGDTITAKGEVTWVHETKPVTKLKFEITNQKGELVFEGEACCYTLQPEE